ncbi:hypothetical protein JCM17823_15290 [Halorubrum gandharaense]
MTPPSEDRPTFDPTREEAWVAHVALLAAGEAAVDDGDETPPQLRAVRAIESDADLDREELAMVHDALVDYLGEAPVRDRAPARSALRDASAALDEPPTA